MIALDAAADVDEAGGKARTLARARRAGLPALDGFVVLPSEAIDVDAIARELARLGGARFAVRSSASVEDSAHASAAGVFASVLDVGASDVPRAIARVRASARSASARAYLASRGLGEARMAVLVQPMIACNDGARVGVLHTAPVEAGTLAAEERAPGEPEWGAVTARHVPLDDALSQLALAAASLVGGVADVEYAITATGPVLLQARPLTAPIAIAAGDDATWDPGDDATWILDAAHNPAPLSAAQASLVAIVDELGVAAPQRVLGGFLYACPERAPAPSVRIAIEQLPRVFTDEILPDCDARLRPLEERARRELTGESDEIERAIDAYRHVARRYFGEVGPAITEAKRALDRLLVDSLGEPLAAHGALLGGSGGATVARDQALWRIAHADPMARPRLVEEWLARYGACARAWDVAAPCDEELPLHVLAAASLAGRGPSPEERQAIARAQAEEAADSVAARLDDALRAAFRALLPSVRAAIAIGEDDDLLFFRAQRAVRRPLRALGIVLASAGHLDDPEQVFDLPFATLAASFPPSLEVARRERSARLDAAHRRPPRRIARRVPAWDAPAGDVLRGVGVPGRARGRVLLLDERRLAQVPPSLPPGTILVTRALLPSLTYHLPSVAALVTDTGGALSHGATLAREYGVPAVLGTGAATSVLMDGEEILVDGDAGRVYRLGRRGRAGA